MEGDTLMKNMEQLIDKIDKYRTSMLGSDILALTPKIGEFNEFINNVAKFSNDCKLSYAWKCLAQDKNVEQSINELYNYVSDAERAFFISNEFRKIILSSSLISSTLIGLIVGEVVSANRSCTHSEAVILNALANLTDYDLYNFIVIMESGIEELDGNKIIQISKVQGCNRMSLEYTLYTCMHNGLIRTESDLQGKGIDSQGYGSLYMGLYYLPLASSFQLLEYINKVKQILPYVFVDRNR